MAEYTKTYFDAHPDTEWDPVIERRCVLAVQRGLSLEDVNGLYDTEPEVVLAAVTRDGMELRFLTDTYYIDMDRYVIPAIQHNGLALQYVGHNLRKRTPIIMTAIRQNKQSIQYVEPQVRLEDDKLTNEDRAFLKKMVLDEDNQPLKQHMIRHIPPSVLEYVKDISKFRTLRKIKPIPEDAMDLVGHYIKGGRKSRKRRKYLNNRTVHR